KKTFYEKHENKIEAFFSPLLSKREQEAGNPRQASETAKISTALALKGWFVRLSGDEDKALLAWKQARAIDAEVGWGYLFEAMAWLWAYFSAQKMPESISGSTGMMFIAAPPETPKLRSIREKVELLLAAAVGRGSGKAPCIWGVELSGDFANAISSVTEIGSYTLRAEESVSAILALSEFLWMEEELIHARASLRYVLKDFDAGMEDAGEFLRRCPESIDMLCRQGDLKKGKAHEMFSKGQNPDAYLIDAIGDYGKALRMNRDHVPAYNNRANAYSSLGEFESSMGRDPKKNFMKAIEDYTQVLQIDPTLASVYSNRADVYCILADEQLKRGDEASESYHKAIEDCNEALRRNPELVVAYNNRGKAYCGLGSVLAKLGKDPRESFRKAIEDFSDAIGRADSFSHAYQNRGFVQVLLGDAQAARKEDPRKAYLQAIEDCNEALRIEPDYFSAYGTRALANWKLGLSHAAYQEDPREWYRHAIASYSDALRVKPKSLKAHFLRGMVYFILAQEERKRGEDPRKTYLKAANDLLKAQRMHPPHADPFVYYGSACKEYGEAQAARGEDPQESFEKAIKNYADAIRKVPGYWQAHADKGQVLEGMGRYQEAIASYESALKIIKDGYPPLKKWLARARSAAAEPAWGKNLALADARIQWGWYEGAAERYGQGIRESAAEGAQHVASLKSAHYNFTRCLAQLSVGKKGWLAEVISVPDEKRTDLQTKAVASLRKAFEYGWTDLDGIRKDADLDPIRDLPAFKALIAEYEEKLKKEKKE
ncbi:MAG: tetratricopeptide repeat protein, partial [Planctomycetota bacterium]